MARSFSLQIFATDLDREAVDKARQGSFPANISADVSPERLKRFFVKEESGYRVAKEIREMVVFAVQNVIMDPPFTKLDILSCRNLLIYLAPELQKKLLPLFHYALNPGGILFLGSAETIGAFTDLFSPLDSKSRLYRRLDSALRAEPVEFPSSFVPPPSGLAEQAPKVKPAVNLQSLADQVLLQQYSPAAVLVNDKGDILYISGRTGKYLEPAAGKANWNIFAMAREGLRYELADAFQKALRQKDAVTLKKSEGGHQRRSADRGSHRPGACRAGGLAGHGDDRLYGRRSSPGNESPGQTAGGPLRRRPAGPDGGGGPAGPGGAAYDPRGDADLPGRAEIGQ